MEGMRSSKDVSPLGGQNGDASMLLAFWSTFSVEHVHMHATACEHAFSKQMSGLVQFKQWCSGRHHLAMRSQAATERDMVATVVPAALQALEMARAHAGMQCA